MGLENFYKLFWWTSFKDNRPSLIINQNQFLMDYITLKTTAELLRVPQADILYFKSDDTQNYCYFKDGTKTRILESLDELQNSLGQGFFRIHKNCIVNINQKFIFCSFTRTVEFSPEDKLLVARGKVTQLRRFMLNHTLSE